MGRKDSDQSRPTVHITSVLRLWAGAQKGLVRTWHSCDCGTELDRDVNAAINILERGRRQRGATRVEVPCL